MQAENMGVSSESPTPEADNIAQMQADGSQVVQDSSGSEITYSQEEDKKQEQERNWRAMREKVDQLQREKDEERQKREEYEKLIYQQLTQNQQKPAEKVVEVDEFADVKPDDWLTYAQSQKLAKKLAEQTAREAVNKALDEDRRKRAEEELPTRLKMQFNDFDAVVTDENVKQLRKLEPEVAQALAHIGDKYAQAVAAYKYIKMLIPSQTVGADYKQRVEQNNAKPGSLSNQSSALSKAQAFERGLTPELKRQLYDEMMKVSKGS